jgi:hypothetical protein
MNFLVTIVKALFFNEVVKSISLLITAIQYAELLFGHLFQPHSICKCNMVIHFPIHDYNNPTPSQNQFKIVNGISLYRKLITN